MLFAARDGEPREFKAPGLPTVPIGGLDQTAAWALIDRHVDLAVSAEVRNRLVRETAGNPLALLELSTTLSVGQLSGTEPLLEPIPVSARVEGASLARVRRLPQQTQTLVLAACVDDSGDLATVLRAAARLQAPAEALDAAEEAGLVRVAGAQVHFHHPLVRSAVYQGAPLSRRQAAHRALAAVLDGEVDADRRAWHAAAASLEPDPSVVDELEQAARRARGRAASTLPRSHSNAPRR